MKSAMKIVEKNSSNIIRDNNFLFAAFQNRLTARLVHIFEKYKIPINKNIIHKNLEENLINSLIDLNVEIIKKYTKLLNKYENIVCSYIEKKVNTSTIKKATMNFIEKISEKNNSLVTTKVSNNFIEYINSIIYVYDNFNLNKEIIERINKDVKEILSEFNRNNYNFVIESINTIIKNIIKNM